MQNKPKETFMYADAVGGLSGVTGVHIEPQSSLSGPKIGDALEALLGICDHVDSSNRGLENFLQQMNGCVPFENQPSNTSAQEPNGLLEQIEHATACAKAALTRQDHLLERLNSLV